MLYKNLSVWSKEYTKQLKTIECRSFLGQISYFRSVDPSSVTRKYFQSSTMESMIPMDFTIVQIIFHFLWNHWAHCGVFENGVLLMYTLEGVSSVANFINAYEESQ